MYRPVIQFARLAFIFCFLVPIQASAELKNVSLKPACKMPSGSYKKSKGVHQFVLENGMVGGCKSSDRNERVRSNGEIEPYKERAEVRTPVFTADRKWRYIQSFKFDGAAKSGPRTTFFQIHQMDRDKKCKPNPGPALMAQLDRGRVQFNLKVNGGSKNSSKNYKQKKTGISRQQLSNWTKLEVRFDTHRDQSTLVQLLLNGKTVLKENIWFTGCGTPYIRTGLYRPGTLVGTNPTDRIWVKEAAFEQLE